MKKTQELITWKYYWLTLRADIESYVKGCDVCLASKSIKPKPYSDLQSLPVLIYWWKDLFIDFVPRLPVSTNWRDKTYDSILVIVNRLTKMVYYELVKVIIDVPALAEVIIKAVVEHYSLLNSIVSDQGSLFTSKFWFSLCYFLDIKQKLSTAFYS